ncbi:hypothetical protein EBI_23305 [Enterocytozoon bieneusi H348]|nr:hypothetical protein EBI_23305 [Enterocytozoon bieneusi H348]|eukprot:XP_002650816.1 hypothetical protein EBI_23305 [Enterocytozoon bieneusi H348]
MKNTQDPFETLTEEQTAEEQQQSDGQIISNLCEYDFWLLHMKVALISLFLTFICFVDSEVYVPL